MALEVALLFSLEPTSEKSWTHWLAISVAKLIINPLTCGVGFAEKRHADVAHVLANNPLQRLRHFQLEDIGYLHRYLIELFILRKRDVGAGGGEEHNVGRGSFLSSAYCPFPFFFFFFFSFPFSWVFLGFPRAFMGIA